MKFILSLLLMFPLCSNGQTKRDTEKWLSYNLNKYFYHGKYDTHDLYQAQQIAKEKGSCEWGSRDYDFDGNNFLIRAVDYQIDASLSRHIVKSILYTFDLSKLLKVSQETYAGEYSSSTRIIFEFHPSYNGVFPYKEYDELNHKYIENDNYDYTLQKIENADRSEERRVGK